MKRLLISIILSILIMFNSVMPTMANTTTVNDNTIVSLSSSNHMEISVISTNGYRAVRGGEKFLIKHYDNGNVIQTVQGTIGGDQILSTSYENGRVKSKKVINVSDRIQKVNNADIVLGSSARAVTNSWGVLGHIIYNKEYGSNVEQKVAVHSKLTKDDNEGYIINGALKDSISDITGLVLSVMGIFLPGASVAAQIAKAIVLHYGGKIIGDAIGVNFTENVSVRAKYYTLRGYHIASNYYTAGFDGVERHVKTVSSKAYNKWLYEGFTPHTWKDGDHLASNIWTAIFGRSFPYVKEYR